MPTKKPKTDTIAQVRRWRKEVFHEVMAMTPEARAAEERKVAKELGLKLADERSLVRPNRPAKKAG